jgi:two-component system, OmpR family, KDP operon response regulator KdpE
VDAVTPMRARRPKILVIDDEPQILRAMRSILSRSHEVELAASGEEGLRLAADSAPDLVILDLTLPGITGMEVCRTLREWLRAPILILSVRDNEADKIAALDLGADDYLTKPFSAGELLAHIRALLRRAGRGTDGRQVRSGDLMVDLAERKVMRGGDPVKLTRIEYTILARLASDADRVVTSGMLIKGVWGVATTEDSRALRVHISNLRSKIEPDPSTPRHVVTEPGVGYRFLTESL